MKVAAAPGATVAVPEVEPVPELGDSVKPGATVKVAVAVAAA